MKKTVSVNMGGVAVVIDDDAYILLSNYLSDIKERCDDNSPEIINDIEFRLSEIFMDMGVDRYRVVTIEMAKMAISQIGSADVFGSPRKVVTEPITKLRRMSSDKVIAGVCSGLARYMDIDPIVIRLSLLLSMFFAGFGLMAYIILWIVLPLDSNDK